MKTSAAGRALIIQREGHDLSAYRDSQGILTIGVGHTGRMSPPLVTAGMRITDAQCDTILATDLMPVEAVLNSAVKVPISQNEFDAMASLGFNIGVGGLKGSTVLKRLNRGDLKGAAAAFMMWDHPALLANRREAEAAQFLATNALATAPEAIAVARTATLSTMAETTKLKARAAQSGAAVLIVAGATTTTAHHHHPTIVLVVGGIMLAAGMGAALLACLGHYAARELARNAGRQGVQSNLKI